MGKELRTTLLSGRSKRKGEPSTRSTATSDTFDISILRANKSWIKKLDVHI